MGGLVPGGGGHSPWLAGGRFSPWPHAAVPLRMSVSSSYEDTSHSGLGPTLMASLYQITSLKVIKEVLGFETSTYDCWGQTIEPTSHVCVCACAREPCKNTGV